MRQFALFGATVLFPCTLLVVYGYRMIRQDRELAAKYAEEEQRARTLQQNQSRLAELEKWKGTAAEDFFAGRKLSVAFATLVVNDEIKVPWPQPAIVRSAIDSCERA